VNPDSPGAKNGFAIAADEGPAFWFLNTQTIAKVGATDTGGRLSIVGHRVPPGFAPPPHVRQESDEALLVLDGELEGFCGTARSPSAPRGGSERAATDRGEQQSR
jgi:hypothetical protein